MARVISFSILRHPLERGADGHLLVAVYIRSAHVWQYQPLQAVLKVSVPASQESFSRGLLLEHAAAMAVVVQVVLAEGRCVVPCGSQLRSVAALRPRFGPPARPKGDVSYALMAISSQLFDDVTNQLQQRMRALVASYREMSGIRSQTCYLGTCRALMPKIL